MSSLWQALKRWYYRSAKKDRNQPISGTMKIVHRKPDGYEYRIDREYLFTDYDDTRTTLLREFYGIDSHREAWDYRVFVDDEQQFGSEFFHRPAKLVLQKPNSRLVFFFAYRGVA